MPHNIATTFQRCPTIPPSAPDQLMIIDSPLPEKGDS